MKKMTKQNILSAILCIALAASITPTRAALFDNFPNTVYGEAGLNQSHDTEYLKDRYNDASTDEDFKKYEQQKIQQKMML